MRVQGAIETLRSRGDRKENSGNGIESWVNNGKVGRNLVKLHEKNSQHRAANDLSTNRRDCESPAPLGRRICVLFEFRLSS